MIVHNNIESAIEPQIYKTINSIFVPKNVKQIQRQLGEIIFQYDEEEYPLEEYFKKITDENEMLKNCVLELSSTIYA